MSLRNICLILLAVTLASCNSAKYREVIDKRSDEARKAVEEARKPVSQKKYNPLTVSDKVWAGNSSTRLRRGMPLPEKFETKRGVTLLVSDPMTLTEIANVISVQTGVPVRIASGTEQTNSRNSPSSNTTAPVSTMPIAYEGPLSGLLDHVTGYFGISWRYDGATINLSRYETRVFMIESLPGVLKIKDGIKEETGSSSSSSSVAGGGSSTNDLQQSSEMSVELKVWEEMEKTITSILGGVGTVVIAPSSGTVTVITTPDVMHTVAKFIEEENKRQSKQIAINVEIYSVSLTEGDDFSATFDAALKRLTDFGATYAGPTAPTYPITGGGKLSLAILNTDRFANATPIFDALSQVGDTTRVAQFPLTTLNNRPVSRRVGRDRSYVQSVQNNNTVNYQTNSVTPGVIREGFSLQVTPRLLDDGRIMLQYSFSLIDIVKVVDFQSGSGDNYSKLQLPETSTRVFVQQSLLKSGSTLIIGGYDDEQYSQKSQGVINPFNYLLGGGVNNSSSHSMLFIAITPQVLEVPSAEQN
ncbi:MAG: secretin N-terminal domain-containing protein [Alphaproteobacteria bacterium]|nr:secretin N-terminal domain-containing protein [Alphaproteobacteria bacterium]